MRETHCVRFAYTPAVYAFTASEPFEGSEHPSSSMSRSSMAGCPPVPSSGNSSRRGRSR